MKRVFVLCMIFVTLMMSLSVYAEETDTTSEKDKLSRLYEYGIFIGDPDGDMRKDDYITRAEFAVVVCRMQGYNLTDKARGDVFTDVPKRHWAARYIEQARDMGVIDGYEDGTFMPENEITYCEALKMLVESTGYAPLIDNTGEYPDGVIVAAEKLGLMSEVSFGVDDYVSRGDCMILVDFTLDIPLMGYNHNDYFVYNGEDGTRLKTLATELEKYKDK